MENKTVITCESGRMVIIEQEARERADNARVLEMAQAGKEEGYVLFSEIAGGTSIDEEAPGLFLSLLLRPMMHAGRAGLLSAAAAVAVAEAMEEVADGVHVSVRWVNDLYIGNEHIGGMATSARIKPNGNFDYAVLGILLSLPPKRFQPKMGDVVRRVFGGETRSLPARLTEEIVRRFFALYDKMGSGTGFLAEYRRRSCIIGKRVKILMGDTYVRARVRGIDDNAYLTVETSGGSTMTVSSRAEVVFPE